jgi:hypothetical protein
VSRQLYKGTSDVARRLSFKVRGNVTFYVPHGEVQNTSSPCINSTDASICDFSMQGKKIFTEEPENCKKNYFPKGM